MQCSRCEGEGELRGEGARDKGRYCLVRIGAGIVGRGERQGVYED